MKRAASFLLMALGLNSLSMGQIQSDEIPETPVVRVEIDKKIIDVSKLNLPESTPVKDIFDMVAELVNRKGEFELSNYDIQIDDMTAGYARDAMISQLRLADIKCIEVSDNSLHSVTSLGQGGSINIILKDVKDGTSGSANIEGAYVPNAMGGLIINHKSAKWTLHGIGNVEYFHPTTYKSTTYADGTLVNTQDQNQHFWSEAARIYAIFKSNAYNIFKFNASQTRVSARNEATYDTPSTTYVKYNDKYQDDTHLYALAEWKHIFMDKSDITLQLNYMYAPQSEKFDNHEYPDRDYQCYNIKYDNNAHNIFGKVVYCRDFIRKTADHLLNLEAGVQSYLNMSSNKATREGVTNGVLYQNTLSSEDNYFLRPYAQLKGKFGAWTFIGIVDYQHYRYTINEKIDDADKYNTHCDDLTGMASVMWQLDKRNCLRLTYNKSLQRATGKQLFPYEILDITSLNHITGNASLVPSDMHTVDLDYLLNLSNSDHTLTFNLGVDYTHANNVIKSVEDDKQNVTYQNSGTYDVYRGDFMAYYSKGIFSVSLAGNVYTNSEIVNGDKDYHTHFNFALNPSLNLKRGWMCSAQIYYNGKVMTNTSTEGELWYASFRVGKTWNHWNVHLFSTVSLNGQKTNSYQASTCITEYADYMKNLVGLGVRYRF